MSERARWRVNQQSFVGHALAEEGAEVYYTPQETAADDPRIAGVGENLSPLNDAAQEIVDAQTEDHPDKSKHAHARDARAAKKAADKKAAEAELEDGPVPKSAAKGDTKTGQTAKAAKSKVGADLKTAKGGGLDIEPKGEQPDEDVG